MWRKLLPLVLAALASLLGSQVAWAVTYGSHFVEGDGVILEINSTEGRYYGPEEAYAFFEEHGLDFKFVVKLGYEVDYAYLYFGDSTGQYVVPGTSYSHYVELHADFVPALIVVYTDESSEKIRGPHVWEAWKTGAELSGERPGTFTPPITLNETIDDLLEGLEHSLAPLPTSSWSCLCGHETDNCAKVNDSLPDECGHTVTGCVGIDPLACP